MSLVAGLFPVEPLLVWLIYLDTSVNYNITESVSRLGSQFQVLVMLFAIGKHLPAGYRVARASRTARRCHNSK
ncbi:hypothetical protein GF325_03395 [Candidatus Bathyarchaeota archaeon]|nr:hypothetical protein [Candidatus Bathyarchaeota archaeon]